MIANERDEISDYLKSNPLSDLADLEDKSLKISSYLLKSDTKRNPFNIYIDVDERLKPFLGVFNPVIL